MGRGHEGQPWMLLAGLALVSCSPTRTDPILPAPEARRAELTTAPDGDCRGLPVPRDALTVFCARQPNDEAWIAALTPLRKPDKAAAELVLSYLTIGGEVVRRQAVQADSWSRSPVVHDFDGDGVDELILSIARPNQQLWTFRDGRIAFYPRPGYPIERFEERDGQLHPVFRIATPIAFDCEGHGVDVPWLLPGITDGEGSFGFDEAALRRECPAAPTGSFLDAASPRDQLRCARVWGTSEREAIDSVLTACEPLREEAAQCRGPCRDLDLLLAAVSTEPPLRLERDRPYSPTTPPAAGTLPPDVIQRIVRQSFGRFRRCYEAGLGVSPSLQGRVVIRFVIDANGRVSEASGETHGIDLPVADCVVRASYQLSFTKPQGGAVHVSYPIVFSPGG